ncbi:hypothetical protein D3C86_2207770 [compost metagenome]
MELRCDDKLHAVLVRVAVFNRGQCFPQLEHLRALWDAERDVQELRNARIPIEADSEATQ